MGLESISLVPDHVVDKSEVESSQAVGCDSIVVERVETNLSKEPFLLVPLENKEDKQAIGRVCCLENSKVDALEAISPKGDILELFISSRASDDSLSLGCETPRESIFDPFATGPEEAACAPKKKVTRGVAVPPRRKLNFDSGDYPVKRLSFDLSDSEQEDQYLQVIHKMILDLLILDGPPDRQLGCETPLESIFDPFATGPEEAACAPKKKVTRGAEVPPRRKLNFDSDDYPVKRLSFDLSDSEEEDQYLQVIHKTILDPLILDGHPDRQEETGKMVTDSSLHESCKTPDSKPLLTGIASTCPDAPWRPSRKVLKLSPGICRKIDFDAVSDKSSSSVDKGIS